MTTRPDRAATVPSSLDGARLDAAVRELFETSWSRARAWIETGKISVSGRVERSAARPVDAAEVLELRLSTPRPGALPRSCLLHVDKQVVVVLKPPGLTTAKGRPNETGTLVDAVQRLLARGAGGRRGRGGARPPLLVVQRLDRGASGVLVFARTSAAAEALRDQLREHSVERRYLALAHGALSDRRYASHLVIDRGDRLRGSLEHARRLGLRPSPEARRKAKLAVTHVAVVERFDRAEATLVSCRLETGRTNQIRIHLAEDGHPLVGEHRYIREHRGPTIGAPRLMLHAAILGFRHPATGRYVRFEAELPRDMAEVVERLRGASKESERATLQGCAEDAAESRSVSSPRPAIARGRRRGG